MGAMGHQGTEKVGHSPGAAGGPSGGWEVGIPQRQPGQAHLAEGREGGSTAVHRQVNASRLAHN